MPGSGPRGRSGIEHYRLLSQFLEHAAQGIADQGVIGDQQNLHPASLRLDQGLMQNLA
jgi:hypothetical protein